MMITRVQHNGEPPVGGFGQVPNRRSSGRHVRGTGNRAFTLLELLVVFVIIGILASITLPALKGIGQANLTAAGNRQILDDLFLARLRAINERTTVYMVFVPPTILNKLAEEQGNPAELKSIANLLGSQFTGYALLAERTVGDQPGRSTPRYLTPWKRLPDGMVFAPYKFPWRQKSDGSFDSKIKSGQDHLDPYLRTFLTKLLPFPNSDSAVFELPYIAFNSLGQLESWTDELIPIAKGRVALPQNDNGQYLPVPPDIQLIPPVTPGARPKTQTNTYQFVLISKVTGRAQIDPETSPTLR